jgi:NAD(P)-dependent dehydrogenase (short-subunit alcohol dehydrogenase family)
MPSRNTKTPPWTVADIGDQTDRTAVITGANSGIGYETALALAARGARVVLACRNLDKARVAAGRITAAQPAARVEPLHLDLGSLASVREAAATIRDSHPRLDLLINNAGVMFPPYGRTEDGFELQFGTNHLGHFALTGLVLPSLLGVAGSRVVTLSSNGHKIGRMHFNDLQSERHYRRVSAYGQSKLANLLFAYELQHHLAASGAATISVAAHPGTSSTQLGRHMAWWMRELNRFAPHQSAAMGALPALRAATDEAVAGGDYYGPGGFGEFTGYPQKVRSSARSHDDDAQNRLWEVSQHLTGVDFSI